MMQQFNNHKSIAVANVVVITAEAQQQRSFIQYSLVVRCLLIAIIAIVIRGDGNGIPTATTTTCHAWTVSSVRQPPISVRMMRVPIGGVRVVPAAESSSSSSSSSVLRVTPSSSSWFSSPFMAERQRPHQQQQQRQMTRYDSTTPLYASATSDTDDDDDDGADENDEATVVSSVSSTLVEDEVVDDSNTILETVDRTATTTATPTPNTTTTTTTNHDDDDDHDDILPVPTKSSQEKEITKLKQTLLRSLLLSTSSTSEMRREEEEEEDTSQSMIFANDDDDGTDDMVDTVIEYVDTVLADPITKEALRVRQIRTSTVVLGGTGIVPTCTIQYQLSVPSSTTTTTGSSTTTTYTGSSDTYIDLLEPSRVVSASAASSSSAATEQTPSESTTFRTTTTTTTTFLSLVQKYIVPWIPPPLRSNVLTRMTGTEDSSYIPMRDLFTSPAVSFAYERGWRQGFANAGFPGVDIEAKMALDYLAPSFQSTSTTNHSSGVSGGGGVLVDMSCATGLFTRKFLQQAYDSSRRRRSPTTETNHDDSYPPIHRILGCDYSDSMLTEARRRFDTNRNFSTALLQQPLTPYSNRNVTLELIRLDVGQIPMQTGSVDALHAGAAMHCWPDLDPAIQEIYRVLKPNGGRYFATTFLSSYFRNLQANDANAAAGMPSLQAFQYFSSVDQLRTLLVRNGFEPHRIQIELLGNACVVIRCEK
jgi:ubiquinone/menaquinone biosynthesis C-methylase UbiE